MMFENAPMAPRQVERLLLIPIVLPLLGGLVLASGVWEEGSAPRSATEAAVEVRVAEAPAVAPERFHMPVLQYASLGEARPLDIQALERAAARMAQAPTFTPPAAPSMNPVPPVNATTPPSAPTPPRVAPPQVSPMPQLPGVPQAPAPRSNLQAPAPAPVVAQAGGGPAIDVNGRPHTLAGLVIPGGRACRALDGTTVDCGARAAAQLALFLQNRAVTCEPHGAAHVCRVGATDVGEWLIRRGLALPDGGRYAAAATFARSHRLGVWAPVGTRTAAVTPASAVPAR